LWFVRGGAIMLKKCILILLFFICAFINLGAHPHFGGKTFNMCIPYEGGEQISFLNANEYVIKDIWQYEEKGNYEYGADDFADYIHFIGIKAESMQGANMRMDYKYYYKYEHDILVLYTKTDLIGIYSYKSHFMILHGDARASSTLIEDKDIPDLYNPNNLIAIGTTVFNVKQKNTLQQFWSEGAEGYGIGEEVIQYFEDPVQRMGGGEYSPAVNGFVIFNGVYKTQELFNKNSRVKTAKINDSTTVQIEDTIHPQIIVFDEIHAEKVIFTIEAVYEGSKWDDTCITKLLFFTFKGPF
jgi:hypothetical protein